MQKIVFHFLFKDSTEDVFSKGVNIVVDEADQQIIKVSGLTTNLYAMKVFDVSYPDKIFLGMYAISEVAKLETLQNEQAQKESSRI